LKAQNRKTAKEIIKTKQSFGLSCILYAILRKGIKFREERSNSYKVLGAGRFGKKSHLLLTRQSPFVTKWESLKAIYTAVVTAPAPAIDSNTACRTGVETGDEIIVHSEAL
jgi:hypothetical protein